MPRASRASSTDPFRNFARLNEWRRARYAMPLGSTGLWQIPGESNLKFDDLVRIDFCHLKNRSAWMDVAMLLRPPMAGFRGRAAF
jgi:lipopolysaccharide/colanic/teichoic acid biosynthesis glycosyltransferase